MTNTGTFKWAFVGDLQIPYHDKRAVELWFKVMKKWKPDAIDIVGDIDDQLEYSTFSDGTTDEFFNQIKANQKLKEKAESDLEKAISAGKENLPAVPEFGNEQINPLPFIKENADGAKQFYTQVR